MMIAHETLQNKRQQLEQIVNQLTELTFDSAHQGRAIHEVEADLFSKLLELGRQLLELFIQLVGPGDLGETVELPDGRQVRRLDETQTRPYRTLFGDVSIERCVYSTRPGQKIELAPTDQRLGLPESDFSYLLQNWDQLLGVEHAWGKVAQTLQQVLGITQHVDSLERMNRHMAESAPAFREQLPAPDPEEEKTILVATVDNKGVPLRRPAEETPPPARRTKGQKANKKRHATLGGVYSVDPHLRTPEDVVAALFHDRPRNSGPKPPTACQKRFRAALSDPDCGVRGQDETFAWLAQEVQSRRRPGQPLVYLTDGQRSLKTDAQAYLADHEDRVDILELLHVVPRIWEAAHLFCKEGSREAEAFVRQRLLRILQGEAKGVIRGLRRMATTHQLRGTKKKTLQTNCNFLEKNLERMRYHEYLAAGLPIASGVIEGACRHVIKDRMERSGMRWTIRGAQAMLDLRTVCINGHWSEFQAFRIEQEHQRLYPHRQAFHNQPWPLAV